MNISALRLPAAFAACFAVVLAGAPGASAAPSAPGASGGPTATAEPTASAATASRPVVPADDELALAGDGGTVSVDVLANDGLPDPAQVRLLLVDPAAPLAEDELTDELSTDAGLLRVVSPDVDPGELPAGWDAPEHPVLALDTAAATAAGAASVDIGYAVVDASGAEVRAVLTVTPRATEASTPEEPEQPTTDAGPTDGTETATEAGPTDGKEPATEVGPTAEADLTGEAEPAAAADPNADVPAEIRQALEAAARRVSARAGGPTAEMRPWKGGWEWPHENGVVLWSAADGANFVLLRGAIGQKWLAGGGVDVLGWPVADESCGLTGGGCRQTFSKSHTVYWTAATRAHTVKTNGAIGHRWILGGREAGTYGYPISDEVCGLAGSGCRQTFSKSHTIYWTSATGAHPVQTNGAIGRKWIAAGREAGRYGYPVGGERCGLVGGGCWQPFSKSHTVYWSPTSGARAVQTNGAIGRKWIASGRERGAFGYPVTDEFGIGLVHQKFQRGVMTWSRSGGTRAYLFGGECHHLNTGRSVQPTHGAARVSLTIAEGYGQSAATFVQCVRIAGSYVEEWRTSAYVGASGFKRPGVPSGHTKYLYSPQGSYSVTESFGVYNPGTALPYRQLNPDSRWGGRLGPLYNKYFESTGYTWPDENMWYFSLSGDYRLGVVINYNRPPDSPIVQGDGFAIFLHANKKPTAGCIALHEHEVARYMRSARPGDRIIMGVRADLFR